MANGNVGIRSIADQRYYHFVLALEGGSASLPAYWRKIGDVVEPGRSIAFRDERCVVEHRKLRSMKAFARGGISEELSEKGAGRPPYFYDVIGIRVELHDAAYLMLGFPFVGLALDAVGQMVGSGAFGRAGEFLAVDVPKLVGVMESGAEHHFEEMRTRIVSLQFVVTDDKALTAVRLGGDDPLSAEIYVKFLRKKVSSGFVRPDLCVLACERDWPRGAGDRERRAFRSRLRVDGHGNFRFYAHVDCGNLRLLPYAIGQLRAYGCLRKVASNPVLRLGRDDE